MSSISVIRVKNGGQQEISSLEAIHNVALEVSKFENSSWDLADLTLYQFYCCPECTYKSQKDFLFRDHMRENHENVVPSKKIKLDASTLIHRFLQEDNNTEIHSIVSQYVITNHTHIFQCSFFPFSGHCGKQYWC